MVKKLICLTVIMPIFMSFTALAQREDDAQLQSEVVTNILAQHNNFCAQKI